MVGLIFQPVLMVGGVGLIMIFLMAMSQVIGTNNAKVGDATIIKSANVSTISMNGVAEVDVVGNRLSGDAADDTKNFFGSMLISLFALFLLRGLLTSLLTDSKNPLLADAMKMNKSLVDLAKNMALSTPIPIGDGKETSV